SPRGRFAPTVALAGRDSELTETTEQAEAIAALLSREPYSGVDYEVEVRHGALPQRARGRGWRLAAPVAILWHAERPLAVLAVGQCRPVQGGGADGAAREVPDLPDQLAPLAPPRRTPVRAVGKAELGLGLPLRRVVASAAGKTGEQHTQSD